MKALLIALCVLATSAVAEAMIIRHDVPDAEYVVADSDYPAVISLFDGWDCSASLIGESLLLTVAHCAMDLEPGQTLDINGASHAIAEVVTHPEWRDQLNYDIALVRLERPVVSVSPLPIYRGRSEAGATVTLVGRGVTATGLQGEEGAVTDYKLRAATNVVSAVDEHFIEVVFEQAGDDGVTALEGVGAAGDSGGPALIEVDGVVRIAGLNSWGEGPDGVGTYGSRDYQSRVSSYLDWIDSVVADPAGEPGPDDPGDYGEPRTPGGCSAAGGSGGPGAALLVVLSLISGWRRRCQRLAGFSS